MASRSKSYPGIILVFILAACLPLCAAVSNNSIFTVDDSSSSGNFHSSPTTSTSIPLNSTNTTDPQWTHENCSSCLSKPDVTAVYGGTYTAVYLPAGNTFQYNISFQFDGNSIYVYLILSKQAPTACTFILDSEATPYTGGNVNAEFQYNALAFSSENLPSQPHTLTITAEGQPNEPNYVNFDFANFTRPSTTTLTATTTRETDTDSPTSSSTSNPHTTLKAIIGGVVGGFIAVVALIAVAAFYRSKRLREMEETHPFTRTRSLYELRANGSRPGPNERERLMPYTLPGPTAPHHGRDKSSTTAPGVTPYDFLRPSHHALNMDPENREQRQGERRLELNNRLEAATTQMRILKTSYARDHTRLQDESRRQRQRQRAQRQDNIFEVNETAGNPSNSDPPLVASGASHPAAESMTAGGGSSTPPSNPGHPLALVPVRMPQRLTPVVEDRSLEEPMVNPYALADMRTQMGIMMDQIQYLRAHQNTPCIQGLTNEPPPGYMDAISPHHRSP